MRWFPIPELRSANWQKIMPPLRSRLFRKHPLNIFFLRSKVMTVALYSLISTVINLLWYCGILPLFYEVINNKSDQFLYLTLISLCLRNSVTADESNGQLRCTDDEELRMPVGPLCSRRSVTRRWDWGCWTGRSICIYTVNWSIMYAFLFSLWDLPKKHIKYIILWCQNPCGPTCTHFYK